MVQPVAIAKMRLQHARIAIVCCLESDGNILLKLAQLAFQNRAQTAFAQVLCDSLQDALSRSASELHNNRQVEVKSRRPAHIGKIPLRRTGGWPGKIPVVSDVACDPQNLIGNLRFAGAARGQSLPSHDHRFMTRPVRGIVPDQVDSSHRRQFTRPEFPWRLRTQFSTLNSWEEPGTSARRNK